jgi:uncharacterized phage protein (TIGR02220 family)
MDKSKGYFIIWRCMFDDTLWINGTPAQKILMIICIGKANHEPAEWSWLGEKFAVERGQFITSIDKLKTAMGKHITIQNIRSALNNLEKYHFLTQIATKSGRLITVLNYSKYQLATNIDTNKEVTKTQQRGNKEVTPNNNNKKNNNDKNDNNEIYNDVISYLNLRADRKYTVIPAHTKFISARIKEGEYTLEDFQKVIDTKVAQWKDKPEDKYLRPETLFGNKFEGYLNEKVKNTDWRKT